jgi:hypothetical protein
VWYVENATLTVDESAEASRAMVRLESYLASSRHCASSFLTHHPTSRGVYMLSVAWESPLWRALAWRYFFDLFASAGVRYAVETRTQVQTSSAAPSAQQSVPAR